MYMILTVFHPSKKITASSHLKGKCNNLKTNVSNFHEYGVSKCHTCQFAHLKNLRPRLLDFVEVSKTTLFLHPQRILPYILDEDEELLLHVADLLVGCCCEFMLLGALGFKFMGAFLSLSLSLHNLHLFYCYYLLKL